VLYPLPEDVSLELAALAEPLAACLHALDLAELQTGSDICILGGGPIGLGVLALARTGGAAKIIVSEPSEYRRQLATRMGADVVVDPLSEDLAVVVAQETGGLGVSAAFECITHSHTMQQAISLVHNGGVVLGVGNASPQDRLALDLNDLHRRGISLRGSFSRAFSFERVVRLLPKLNLAPLLTHRMQLEGLPEAMQLARAGLSGKVLLTP
jgi:L-iditol 2-dehydrogenase